MRVVVAELGQPDLAHPFFGKAIGLVAAGAAEQRPRRHVVQHGAPREDRVGLEHEADARIDAGHSVAHQPHLAGARLEQAGDQAQRGRFAASRRSDDGDELALAHAHGEVAQSHGGSAVGRDKAAGDTLEFDGRHVLRYGIGHEGSLQSARAGGADRLFAWRLTLRRGRRTRW